MGEQKKKRKRKKKKENKSSYLPLSVSLDNLKNEELEIPK